MFGISFEHILIVGVILLIMGPRRLPELGNTMGKAIKNFKDSFNGIEEASYKRVNETKTEAIAPGASASATDTTIKAEPELAKAASPKVDPSREAQI